MLLWRLITQYRRTPLSVVDMQYSSVRAEGLALLAHRKSFDALMSLPSVINSGTRLYRPCPSDISTCVTASGGFLHSSAAPFFKMGEPSDGELQEAIAFSLQVLCDRLCCDSRMLASTHLCVCSSRMTPARLTCRSHRGMRHQQRASPLSRRRHSCQQEPLGAGSATRRTAWDPQLCQQLDPETATAIEAALAGAGEWSSQDGHAPDDDAAEQGGAPDCPGVMMSCNRIIVAASFVSFYL